MLYGGSRGCASTYSAQEGFNVVRNVQSTGVNLTLASESNCSNTSHIARDSMSSESARSLPYPSSRDHRSISTTSLRLECSCARRSGPDPSRIRRKASSIVSKFYVLDRLVCIATGGAWRYHTDRLSSWLAGSSGTVRVAIATVFDERCRIGMIPRTLHESCRFGSSRDRANAPNP